MQNILLNYFSNLLNFLSPVLIECYLRTHMDKKILPISQSILVVCDLFIIVTCVMYPFNPFYTTGIFL